MFFGGDGTIEDACCFLVIASEEVGTEVESFTVEDLAILSEGSSYCSLVEGAKFSGDRSDVTNLSSELLLGLLDSVLELVNDSRGVVKIVFDLGFCFAFAMYFLKLFHFDLQRSRKGVG